jgi:hypothetical protein
MPLKNFIRIPFLVIAIKIYLIVTYCNFKIMNCKNKIFFIVSEFIRIFSSSDASMNFAIIIPFILYFALVVGIGVYTTRYSSRGMTEFFLVGRQVGRQVGRLVVALSAVVPGRSAWLLLGVTGMVTVFVWKSVPVLSFPSLPQSWSVSHQAPWSRAGRSISKPLRSIPPI